MKTHYFTFLFLTFSTFVFGQFPTVYPSPTARTPPKILKPNDMIAIPKMPINLHSAGNILGDYYVSPVPRLGPPKNEFGIVDIDAQNQEIIEEAREYQIRKRAREEQEKGLVRVNYLLPSRKNIAGTSAYYQAFNKLEAMDKENYSVGKVNFLIENAYYKNKMDEAKFTTEIKQAGDFLRKKMAELHYDSQSNVAKNLIIFQFFAEKLTLKEKNQVHKAFKYDFEDYMGKDDFTKMFVSKLMKTGSGQCHSLPLLYLILAEEIGAEAYLALSPNHSYIRFPDAQGNMENIELTNGMFSTDSFIFQSGYIKAEALKNKIYMQNLNKKELFSHFYTDLANGYIHQFGYDEFVGRVIGEALELYPNNINANMLQANFAQQRVGYVFNQIGIHSQEDMGKIADYPSAIRQLNEAKQQDENVHNLGYEEMPAEAYQSWLASMRNEKEKQNKAAFSKLLNGLNTGKLPQIPVQMIKEDPKAKKKYKKIYS